MGRLIQKRPYQMMIAFQPFVRAFGELTDVLNIADLLLQSKSLLINLDEGRLLLALLFQLYAAHPSYRAQRAADVVHLFLDFLGSRVPSNVILAYMGLSHLTATKASYAEPEVAPIIADVASWGHWHAALTVIARLTDFPITDEFAYALTMRASESPLPLIFLMRLAPNPLSFLVLKWRGDLTAAAERFPALVFRLVIIFSQNVGQR
jgi:hypothetical protein